VQRMARAQFGVVLAVIIAAGFWLNHAVPLGAGWLQGMKPWSEETTSKPKRAWDALLWDGVAQVYPWRVWMSRSLRSGYLPLWNPHQYCGYPMVGNGQSEVFYPPNWLLLILSPVTFLSVSLAFHAATALLLTYLYCRCLKIGPWGSALAGLAFVMGGFFVTWAELAALVNTVTWLPGCLLGIELLRLGRRSGLAVLAVCLGLTLLAGHMQIAAYVWIAAGVYAVIALGRGAADGGRLWLAAWIGLAFAGGLMLGCAQLLPTVELAINSSRGTAAPSAAGWAFWQMRAIQPVELATFVYPFALGNPARGTYPGLSFSEHCGYVGVVTLLLAAVALALRRDRLAWGFAVASRPFGLGLCSGCRNRALDNRRRAAGQAAVFSCSRVQPYGQLHTHVGHLYVPGLCPRRHGLGCRGPPCPAACSRPHRGIGRVARCGCRAGMVCLRLCPPRAGRRGLPAGRGDWKAAIPGRC